MKAYIPIIAVAACLLLAGLIYAYAKGGSAASLLQGSDKDGHVLSSQWDEYEKALKDDRPKKMVAILNEIKAEAIRQHLPVDFYDAGELCIEKGRSINWKDYDSLKRAFAKDVETFDDPLVTFIWGERHGGKGLRSQLELVSSHSSELQGRRETHLWSRCGSSFESYTDFITNDYEFALWSLLYGNYYSVDTPETNKAYIALKDYLKESYPGCAKLEYFAASRMRYKSDRLAECRRIAAKYAGKAYALYPREDLLENKFDSLGKAEAPQQAYRDLYEECKAYIKEKNAFTGDEKKLVAPLSGVQTLMDRMTDESIGVRVKNDTVRITFRNLKKATLTLSELKEDDTQGKTLKTWQVTNKAGSFYLPDTETVAVPVVNDGKYRFDVTSGKYSDRYIYSTYTLSMAVRHDADAMRFYVADYVTGEPLEAVKLMLFKGSDKIRESTVTLRGFTPVPSEITQSMKRSSYYYLRAAYTDAKGRTRLSNDISIYDRTFIDRDTTLSDNLFCNIYKDKGAYNPDDVMHFKAVLFRGDLRSAVAALPAGEKVKVTLRNASDKEIASKELKTTEFGSVSGEFLLQRGEKNGFYKLSVLYKGETLGTDSFRVDDFILPTYTVSLDRVEELITAGDSVTVRGKVESYSGHSLTAAKVRARIMRYGSVKTELETVPAQDGSFELHFLAKESGHHSVDVTVTDATGETAAASTSVYVTSHFSLDARFDGKADASAVLFGDENNTPVRYYYRPVPSRSTAVLHTDTVSVTLIARNSDRMEIPMEISWKLLRDGDETLVKEGVSHSGEKLSLDLSKESSGVFRIEMKASAKDHDGDEIKAEENVRFLLVRPGSKKIHAPVRRVFIAGKTELSQGEDITLRFGSNDGPTWAVVTLYGQNRKVLESRVMKVAGGEMKDLVFPYKEAYPDVVRLCVFYFKYGQEISYEKIFRRVRNSLDLPVTFSSFTDKTLPSTQYTFSVKAAPGVEALAAVYDKSIDAIARNIWHTVSLSDLTISSVVINTATGRVSGSNPYRFSPDYVPGDNDDIEEEVDYSVAFEDTRARGARNLKSATLGAAVTESMVAMAPMERAAVVDEEAADDGAAVTAQEEAAAANVKVREVFADALTFQPHLQSDADGNVSFTFSTSDKLSTYYVAVYAHDKNMRNGKTLREMQVTVPVKVAVVEPKYLYETDSYTLGVTVSSNSEVPVKGKLMLFLYPGADHQHLEPVSAVRKEVTVPVGGAVSETFSVAPGAADTLGMKVVFTAESGIVGYSDAVFVPIEVRKAVQTLTEAHSAVWLYGTDKEALKKNLRDRFVNVPASEAAYSEITILDMVKEALPSKYEPEGKDVLSLSETYYVQLISESLKTGVKTLPAGSEELLQKILACLNSDGGFGWFEGMRSSRIITAVMLERFALLRDRGFSVPDLSNSVHFLDKGQFDREYPYWCGWLSDSQYLYVRSMYPSVSFDYTPSDKDAKERFSEFKKETKAYLVPGRKAGRGLNGYILGKARRIRTLRNLLSCDEGIALARKLGVKLSARNRMDKSMVADLLSLVEYAVKHPDGGWYYPNAVMPYRGLLESEAYAHSLICDLLTSVGMEKNASIHTETGEDAGAIADGIRLWLMLQKETQKWEEDPAFVNAISSILDGSKEVLATEVLIYKATYTKPFKEIAAAGNGFTVARKFYREGKTSSVLEEIAPGTLLQRGDRIIAKYQIWNKENRSFVKLTAPREASLRPVNQLSGHVGWWLRPLSYGWYSFSPQGYRNVLTDKTEYFFDSYPEENTTLTEEFFVTQAGSFSAPVVSIESLYAPHYRANDGFGGPLVSR